mgnify:FL=1
MKTYFRLIFFCCMSTSLTGCCPNGCFVLTGDAYRALAYPKPMRDFWKKEGTSDESRAQDWVACGGTKNGDFSPYEKDLEAEQSKSGLDFFKAYMQLLYKVQRCMRNQGYRFIGECYDTFESKETPACGGP